MRRKELAMTELYEAKKAYRQAQANLNNAFLDHDASIDYWEHNIITQEKVDEYWELKST